MSDSAASTKPSAPPMPEPVSATTAAEPLVSPPRSQPPAEADSAPASPTKAATPTGDASTNGFAAVEADGGDDAENKTAIDLVAEAVRTVSLSDDDDTEPPRAKDDIDVGGSAVDIKGLERSSSDPTGAIIPSDSSTSLASAVDAAALAQVPSTSLLEADTSGQSGAATDTGTSADSATQRTASGSGAEASTGTDSSSDVSKDKYRKIVCRHWFRGFCMKGAECTFLHHHSPDRMPQCQQWFRYGSCRDPQCQFKHSGKRNSNSGSDGMSSGSNGYGSSPGGMHRQSSGMSGASSDGATHSPGSPHAQSLDFPRGPGRRGSRHGGRFPRDGYVEGGYGSPAPYQAPTGNYGGAASQSTYYGGPQRFGTGGVQGGAFGSKVAPTKGYVCHRCGVPGHWKKDCLYSPPLRTGHGGSMGGPPGSGSGSGIVPGSQAQIAAAHQQQQQMLMMAHYYAQQMPQGYGPVVPDNTYGDFGQTVTPSGGVGGGYDASGSGSAGASGTGSPKSGEPPAGYDAAQATALTQYYYGLAPGQTPDPAAIAANQALASRNQAMAAQQQAYYAAYYGQAPPSYGAQSPTGSGAQYSFGAPSVGPPPSAQIIAAQQAAFAKDTQAAIKAASDSAKVEVGEMSAADAAVAADIDAVGS